MRTFRYLILVGWVVMGFMAACGIEPETDTGEAALELHWTTVEQSQGLRAALTGIVDTIKVTVRADGKVLVTQSFNYEDLTGTVTDIPAGKGRSFLVEAIGSNVTLYSGTAEKITINKGGKENVSVDMMPVYPQDIYAPAAIADLEGTVSGSNITLTWTATGNDVRTGTAASYDIRMSSNPIDDSNFDAATPLTVPLPPTPVAAGGTQQYQVTERIQGTCTYYFAIKVIDKSKNVSAISSKEATATITTCSQNNADGCCPPNCSKADDVDCATVCGDGLKTGLETCDNKIVCPTTGCCPTTCDDGIACTTDGHTGSAATCDYVCTHTTITTCIDSDGCCPSGCNTSSSNLDNDCPAHCGNGRVEGTEICDGNCPTTCDDGIACTTDGHTGSAATCDYVCTHTTITTCIDSDGCCPSGCNTSSSNLDNDCPAHCGNGRVEGTEQCDPPNGNTCNSSCKTRSCGDGKVEGNEECDPPNGTYCDTNCKRTCSLTSDSVCPTGHGCNFSNDIDCPNNCNNGVVDSGETCDMAIIAGQPGACPTSCSAPNNCTTSNLQSAGMCTAICMEVPITACTGGDSCCGSGCTYPTDTDCPDPGTTTCDNNTLETGETCDPLSSCPTTCTKPDACTSATLQNGSTCTAICVYATITTCVGGDSCCPPGCTHDNDIDCTP